MRWVAATVLVAIVASLGLVRSGTSARTSVVLVPIGSFGEPSLSALAAHFRHKLHIDVRVLASVPVPADAYNSSRRQYVGDRLLAQVERAHRGGVVIGIIAQDIYMAKKAFRFVFSIRDSRAGVVATARMNPRFFGLPADKELLTSRIEKMTTKDIGALALGRRESSNPRSVLYTPILSLDDLDFMTEDFAPRPPCRQARLACKREDGLPGGQRTAIGAAGDSDPHDGRHPERARQWNRNREAPPRDVPVAQNGARRRDARNETPLDLRQRRLSRRDSAGSFDRAMGCHPL
jgi:predicted Zn-dependent protease